MHLKKYPLTDIQLAYLIGKGSNMYLGGNSVHVYIEYEGNAEPEKVEKALNKVIQRHEALRIVINDDGTQSLPEETAEYHIGITDISAMNAEERDSVINRHREEYSSKIYSSGVWPMFSFHAFRMSETCFRYAFDTDLMIMDRSSIELLFKEIDHFYNDEGSELPAIEHGFLEYAQKRNEFKAHNYKKDREYWEEYIDSGMLCAPSDIPVNEGIGNASSLPFVTAERFICAEKWQEIKKNLIKMRIAPSVFIMTAYAKGLSLWQNTPDTAINMTTALRNIDGINYGKVLGDFTELLIADVHFEKGKSLTDTARTTQKKIIDHMQHLSFGGIKVMNYLAEREGKESAGICPYAFTCSVDDGTSRMRSNILGENVYQISQTPQLKIDCQVYEENQGLIIRFDYPHGVCTDSAVEAVLKYVVKSIMGDDLSYVTKEQTDYNSTMGTVPEVTIQSMIRDAVKKYPEKTAIICEGKKISYSELDRLSDEYAHFIEENVGTGCRVAVEASRTIETVAAIVGILKTGGSYIPLEPKWPEERKNYIQKKAECRLYLDDYSVQKTSGKGTYEIKGSADDEAYIIFTSGSTGKPKGVMISQRAVCNTLLDINERFGVTEKDVLIGISSFCFDLSVYDMFGAFISGATLALSVDMQTIADTAVITGATVWNTVPAIMELFLNELGDRKCSLKNILLSGDWIPLNLKEKIDNKIPGANVYSLGGATEGSVWSIYYPIGKIDKKWKSIPYGYPLGNQTIWILSESDEICPIDVAGEICIGGAGVAEGYAGDKEKTDAQFFVHETLGRLYRTGDYGIFRKEGYVEFIGRRDFQVKVNGYRIELGEIENVINEDENVNSSVVRIVESENGAQHILAYAVPEKTEGDSDTDEYRKCIEKSALAASDVISAELSPEEYTEVSQAFDETAVEVIRDVFREWGYLSEADRTVSFEDIKERGLVAEKYEKLMNQWINVMIHEGDFYTDAYGTVRCKKVAEKKDMNAVYDGLNKISKSEKLNGFRDFLVLSGRKVFTLLKTEDSPLSILFPNGDWERAENFYSYSPSAQYLNNIVAESVSAYISSLKKTQKRIKILEVGAGVGGTTAAVLEKIDQIDGIEPEYYYTDLSEFFTEAAKVKFAKYDFVKYGFYDLNVHPEMQGYDAGSFDIVIGANSVHDSSYLKKSLGYIRTMLKKDGILVLLEGTENLIQYKTTIGLIDGFSGYSDERRQKNEILLSVDEWRSYIEESGYTGFMSFPPENHRAGAYNQHIMISFAANSGTVIDKTAIMEKIKEVLPEYMLPENIYTIESIPLSANGKVERSGLPVPEYDSSHENSSYVAPATELQKTIAGVFEKVLNITDISADTNIFRTGADSLRAIIIISELEKNNIKISLSELYKYPDAISLECFINENDRIIEFSDKSELYRKSDRDIYAPFRLTDQQQSYVFGRVQNIGGVDALPTGGYFEISCDDLDIRKLEDALDKVIKKNEIFRCVFNEDGTGQFLEEVPFRHISCNDKRGLDEKQLEEYITETRKRVIGSRPDIKKPPVMTIEATRVSNREYYIHMYVDGLMLDGWSAELFIAELGHLYKTGEYIYGNDYDVTFLDYVDYTERHRETEKYRNDKKYWEDKLDDLPDAATLPVLKSIDELGNEQGVQNLCGISEKCWNKIAKRAASYGISLFSVLLTSFAYVIGRWNNKKRFLLNIPEFNRPPLGEDIDRVMGVYSSFLLFTSEIDCDKSFIDNARIVQNEIIELKEHNSFTGMEIIREIARRSDDHSTDVLVPIVFGMMPDAPNYNENYLEIEKSLFKIRYQENHTTLVWIDINVLKRSGRVDFNWCSVKGLFDERMIKDMTSMQEEILNMAADDDEFWERSLRLELPERDRKVIDESNDTDKPLEFTDFATIIRDRFRRFADKEFICDMNISYTYKEAEEIVRNIAGRLIECGVSQGDNVALYTRKSISQILHEIAIAYIGAVFVPIEYDYPKNAVMNCINQTSCKVLIASEEKEGMFSGSGIKVINDDYSTAKHFEGEINIGKAAEDSLVYIMHTSGSTGVPKAVEVYQRSLLNCVDFTAEYCALTSDDKSIALTNAAHDLSVYDVFGMLYTGGSIAVPDEDDRRDPQRWAELISRRKVTFWNSVPAMQEMLMEYLSPEQTEQLSSLRTIILGGDYVKTSLAKKIFAAIPSVKLISIGGPTETTIWNIMHTVTEDDIENGVIPYGKPISNSKYHILGENLDELPLGVTGMMYCSGVQLARGYCGNAKETDKKFFIHPRTGERLYETGDMGKYAENGEIIFMGRRDNQIKIHGKRIELGGINSVIGKMEGITRSAVLVMGQKIVAFCSGTASEKQIISCIGSELPEYMIPDSIILLDTIPLKSNGKTDNKALTEIYEGMEHIEETAVTESKDRSDALLEKVSAMFCEVLNCKAESEDDFFELGGDSMTAITLLNKIRELSPQYGLRDFYKDHCVLNVVNTLKNSGIEN